MKKQISILLSVVLASTLKTTAQDHPFMGQVFETPTVFYPGQVSTEIDKFNTSMSPHGLTIYYTATSQKLGITSIAYQRYQDGSYSAPSFVPFANDLPMADVQISPDGQTMFFTTFMDYEGKPEGFNFNIWTSALVNGVWQSPEPLGSPVASKGNEFYPITTDLGTLYFNSDMSGNSDLYYSQYQDGRYLDPVALPPNINTSEREADAFIARDESYLIFVRVDQEDGFGNSDLYISFRTGDNTWTDPVNMGEDVNSNEIDGSPYVTPDGGYLIFTSGRKFDNAKKEVIGDYEAFRRLSSSYQNGTLNFFIMSFDAEEYRG